MDNGEATEMNATERAMVCAICGNDRFFLMLTDAVTSGDIACTGCGVRTGVRIGSGADSSLVEAPK